ncbi:CLUMA_CG015695, isoform A [Clunio marinus]|uniref:CLUMA_CG015695, isoform A n=1 Tax=Clunio marinus TaxID=568069 RepID=A0A1J1IQP5_9DIPT|nr:CLUMA_CG015695, isoform A [Clunio marinus]
MKTNKGNQRNSQSNPMEFMMKCFYNSTCSEYRSTDYYIAMHRHDDYYPGIVTLSQMTERIKTPW